MSDRTAAAEKKPRKGHERAERLFGHFQSSAVPAEDLGSSWLGKMIATYDRDGLMLVGELTAVRQATVRGGDGSAEHVTTIELDGRSSNRLLWHDTTVWQL
jgi:hypothetical protein